MRCHERPWCSTRALILLLALFAAVTPAPAAFSASTACPAHYAGGQAPEITNTRLASKAREACYMAFGVMHSGLSRTPLWSAEHLTRDHLVEASHLPRVNSFHPEDRLPSGDRAELRDYARSGFDRGHMAPSADMPTPEAQQESFSLANMVPQDPDNNRHLWEGIESAIRTLTKQRGELYIITGPLFRGGSLQQLNGRVLVPTHLFKAVYDPQRRDAAAYLVENTATPVYSIISLAELEELAGIDLFPALPAGVKQTAMPLPAPRAHQGSRRPTGRSYDRVPLRELQQLREAP